MPESRTGGALAVAALRDAAIDTVFALPGHHINAILAAARSAGLRLVPTRHEENAVLMAAGAALSTGRTGVACVTAGPGLTNAVPGIAEANASGIPVVVIAGRTAVRLQGRGAVQDVDQLTLVSAVTKWRAACHDPARIPEYVAAALRHAATGSPGVAYLEIPEDVLESEAVPPDVAWATGFGAASRPVPEPPAVARAVELLGSAQRPVALAGSGAFFSGAGDALQNFTETTGIPVVTTAAARGLLPDDHPHCAGSLVHGGAALLSSDVPLVLGSRFNANLLYGGPPLFNPEAAVVQVDVRAEHTGGPRRPELALIGDVAATLEALTAAWGQSPDRYQSWRGDVMGAAAASRSLWSEEADRPANGVHPGWLARATARFAEEHDAPFVVDGGDSVIWGLAFGNAPRPGSHPYIGSALGTLGIGLPYGVAAALAAGHPAVLFTGDGAFGMSAMELDTASRQEVPVLVVVVNNGGWGGGVGPGVRYHLLAEAVGGRGWRVEAPGEVGPALQEAWTAMQGGRPAVIDAVTDPSVHSQFMSAVDSLTLM